MFKYCIAALLFYVFVYINKNKKNGYANPSSFILLIYAISLFLSIPYLYVSEEQLPLENKYIEPLFFGLFILIAYLFPFYFFNETKIKVLKIPSLKILNIFSNFIIICSFFSMIFFIPVVINVLFSGALGEARNAIATGEINVSESVFNTIASVSASMYVFAIFLFFVYLIIGGQTKRCVLLFLSSFSYILNVLAYVGRDGIVFWVMSFLFCYLFFKDFISINLKNKLTKIFISVASILALPFLAISFGRFDDETIEATLRYMGESLPNLALYLGIDNPPLSLGQAFPLYYEITGTIQPQSAGLWAIGGTYSWVFGFFVKSFYASLGLEGMLLLCIMSFICFAIIFQRKKEVFDYGLSFIYIMYFQVFSQGVFYFRQSNRGGNLFLVLCILLFITFRIVQKFTSSIYIKKQV